MNTNQIGQSMSRERNEHPVKSVVVGSRESFIYIGTYVPNLQKKKKKKQKKRKKDIGTGTTLTGTGTTHAKRGSDLLVLVPHL